MSNPGVILLAEQASTRLSRWRNGSRLRRVQVEDNIGEAIHIHLNDMRLDMTIKEFLIFAEACSTALDGLFAEKGLKLSEFDPLFVKVAQEHWKHVTGVDVEEIPLSALRCVVYEDEAPDLFRFCQIEESHAFRYLSKGDGAFLDYVQKGYLDQSNATRLTALNQSIAREGYGDDHRLMVLFGEQNIIRDGQHRAACLLHQGHTQVKVKRVRFEAGYEDHVLKQRRLVTRTKRSLKSVRSLFRRAKGRLLR